MCHFLAPVGQPEMMHKNFMRRHLRISVVRCSGMKFFAHFQLNTPQIKPLVSLRNQRLSSCSKKFFEIFSLRGLKTDRLYAVPRYDNAQCSDCGGQCDYFRAGTVSPRKRYDAAFIDDCQGEEAHQSEPDDRRYPAHACRRQNQSCQKYGTVNFRSSTSPSAIKRKRRNHKGYTVSEN